MKKIVNTALACAALILASCNNFLDIVPTGRVVPKNYKEYKALIINAYNMMPEDRGLASFRSDEIDFTTKDASDIAAYRDIYLWNDINKAASTAEFNYRIYYHIIFLANHVIEEQHSISEGTPAEVSQLVGEAYLLRAYSHFLLVNLFAKPYNEATAASTPGIPIKTSVSMDDVPMKSSVKEVYDLVLSDIAEAETRLKIDRWGEKQNAFRFSKRAASAFKARVLLYMSHWADAAAAATQTIAFPGGLEDLQSSANLPVLAESSENILALERIFADASIGAATPSAALVKLYNKDDRRKGLYIKAVTLEIYQVIKKGGENYRCSFRLGEQYLIAAEAYAQSENLEAAKGYILSLLKTRLRPAYYDSEKSRIESLTKEDFLVEVALERQRELCFEGHRWFDLRRTAEADRPTLVHETVVLQPNDLRYTIPFPKEAVENNPNLGSN